VQKKEGASAHAVSQNRSEGAAFGLQAEKFYGVKERGQKSLRKTERTRLDRVRKSIQEKKGSKTKSRKGRQPPIDGVSKEKSKLNWGRQSHGG